MIRQVTAAVVAALAVGLAPLASAQAAVAAPKPLPNPCRTFTVKAADTLLRVSSGTHLRERLSVTTVPYTIRTCTVTHGKAKLTVQTQRHPGAFGMGFNCYKRPKLGSYGTICVSSQKTIKFTFVVFHKDGVYVSDGINATLPRKGARLYQFALPQYHAFKG
jgi:hypothetical protein